MERPGMALEAPAGSPAAPAAASSAWSDKRVRAELAEFLAERQAGHWPTQAEFRAAGRERLLTAVLQRGGATRWAAEFRLPVARPGRKRHWTDARIRSELESYLEGKNEWPAKAEFMAERPDLLKAIYKHPGRVEYWATQFGLRPRRRREWTPRLIRAALADFLAGRDTWPTHREFKLAGHHDLLQAVYGHGGSQRWAAEFGLTVRPHGRLGHP